MSSAGRHRLGARVHSRPGRPRTGKGRVQSLPAPGAASRWESRLQQSGEVRERDIGRGDHAVAGRGPGAVVEAMLEVDTHAHPELLDVERRPLPSIPADPPAAAPPRS